ncbi:MAG: BtpA family membrane complex biogenesis protein [Oscillospiraceae bacterium]|nr:BtpA family membrane complex biogenesis protein [Oscillospiraceae bacterium]
MATCFDNLNGKKLVIGLVHLLPMLGTPLYQDGNLEKMTEKALADVKTLKDNGADGCLIQTVDVFYPNTDDTDYARVAGLAAVTARCRDAVGSDFIIGAQIMWNCITPSLAVCKAAGADFTRCSALVGDVDSMYGKIEAQPLKVAEYRKKIEAGNIGLLAEISGYHHIGVDDLAQVRSLAGTSIHLGANAVEVCDRDFKKNEELIKAAKQAGNIPVILGGGTSVENAKDRLKYADGALVGTAFEGGKWGGPIIGEIVKAYVDNVRELERELQ